MQIKYHRSSFLKKILILPITVVIPVFFLLIFFVYALNTTLEGYRVDKSGTQTVMGGNTTPTCKIVKNNCLIGSGIFVPTKTDVEWNGPSGFVSKHTSAGCITVSDCMVSCNSDNECSAGQTCSGAVPAYPAYYNSGVWVNPINYTPSGAHTGRYTILSYKNFKVMPTNTDTGTLSCDVVSPYATSLSITGTIDYVNDLLLLRSNIRTTGVSQNFVEYSPLNNPFELWWVDSKLWSLYSSPYSQLSSSLNYRIIDGRDFGYNTNPQYRCSPGYLYSYAYSIPYSYYMGEPWGWYYGFYYGYSYIYVPGSVIAADRFLSATLEVYQRRYNGDGTYSDSHLTSIPLSTTPKSGVISGWVTYIPGYWTGGFSVPAQLAHTGYCVTNAKCGSAHGSNISTQPTTGFCSRGNYASDIKPLGTGWEWSCLSPDLGSVDYCSSNKSYIKNGSCLPLQSSSFTDTPISLLQPSLFCATGTALNIIHDPNRVSLYSTGSYEYQVEDWSGTTWRWTCSAVSKWGDAVSCKSYDGCKSSIDCFNGEKCVGYKERTGTQIPANIGNPFPFNWLQLHPEVPGTCRSAIRAVCGTFTHSCLVGTFEAIDGYASKWYCKGLYGGAPAFCTQPGGGGTYVQNYPTYESIVPGSRNPPDPDVPATSYDSSEIFNECQSAISCYDVFGGEEICCDDCTAGVCGTMCCVTATSAGSWGYTLSSLADENGNIDPESIATVLPNIIPPSLNLGSGYQSLGYPQPASNPHLTTCERLNDSAVDAFCAADGSTSSYGEQQDCGAGLLKHICSCSSSWQICSAGGSAKCGTCP